jgi:hypothetical protein
MQPGSSETLIGWKSGKNHLCPSMEPNGGNVAMDSVKETTFGTVLRQTFWYCCDTKMFTLRVSSSRQCSQLVLSSEVSTAIFLQFL